MSRVNIEFSVPTIDTIINKMNKERTTNAQTILTLRKCDACGYSPSNWRELFEHEPCPRMKEAENNPTIQVDISNLLTNENIYSLEEGTNNPVDCLLCDAGLSLLSHHTKGIHHSKGGFKPKDKNWQTECESKSKLSPKAKPSTVVIQSVDTPTTSQAPIVEEPLSSQSPPRLVVDSSASDSSQPKSQSPLTEWEPKVCPYKGCGKKIMFEKNYQAHLQFHERHETMSKSKNKSKNVEEICVVPGINMSYKKVTNSDGQVVYRSTSGRPLVFHPELEYPKLGKWCKENNFTRNLPQRRLCERYAEELNDSDYRRQDGSRKVTYRDVYTWFWEKRRKIINKSKEEESEDEEFQEIPSTPPRKRPRVSRSDSSTTTEIGDDEPEVTGRKRKKILFDSETEIPLMTKWFHKNYELYRNSSVDMALCGKMADKLNSLEFRKDQTKLTPRNLYNWFQNYYQRHFKKGQRKAAPKQEHDEESNEGPIVDLEDVEKPEVEVSYEQQGTGGLTGSDVHDGEEFFLDDGLGMEVEIA